MKSKLIIALLAVVGLIAAGSAYAQGITGSAHDFSGASWNTTGKICLPCHTPHHGTSVLAPLWNHAATTNSFDLYTSDTLDATVGQPSSESLACLSCHDGTVALDSFGGNAATNSTFMTGAALVGTDLKNDHPVSFTYDDTLANTDGSLHTPSDTASGLAGGGFIADDLLFGGKMECASCHDVHNSTGLDGLLVIDNAGSDLCLTCHNK
ncbi:MAG TPA: cytochrome c3 family protein [Pontiella sp.]|nr:cytochrome c3 family protein [Pontiella sp.]